MTRRRVMVTLTLVVAAAFVLRMALIFAQQSWKYPNDMEHGSIAAALVKHGGFSFGDFNHFGPSSVQSPPYPLLLYVLFQIFGIKSAGAYIAAMIINAVVGTAGVYATYVLARTLSDQTYAPFSGPARGALDAGVKSAGKADNPPQAGPLNVRSEVIALVAAGLCAIWPTQVYAVSYAQAITIITTATTAIVALWYISLRTGRVGPWIAYSLIGTIAALTEPVLLPIMALSGLLVLIWPSVLKAPERFRNAGILLLAAILVIGPWSVRNRVVHSKWIPIKSTFWVNVWKANNPYATGTDRLGMQPERQRQLWSDLWKFDDTHIRDPKSDPGRQYDMLTPEQRKELNGKPDAAREEIFAKYAKTWISENPGEYFRLCLKRLKTTLLIDWDNPKSYNFAYIVPKVGLLVMTVIGIIIAIRRRWTLMYPALLVGSCLLTYTLTITAARFTIPLEPIQLSLAALVVASLLLRPKQAGAMQAASQNSYATDSADQPTAVANPRS